MGVAVEAAAMEGEPAAGRCPEGVAATFVGAWR